MDESAVPARYKIRVRGILSETLLGAFPGLHAQARGSQTVLVGPLPDQAALHGVLAWIGALGLELLEVRRLAQRSRVVRSSSVSASSGSLGPRRRGRMSEVASIPGH